MKDIGFSRYYDGRTFGVPGSGTLVDPDLDELPEDPELPVQTYMGYLGLGPSGTETWTANPAPGQDWTFTMTIPSDVVVGEILVIATAGARARLSAEINDTWAPMLDMLNTYDHGLFAYTASLDLFFYEVLELEERGRVVTFVVGGGDADVTAFDPMLAWQVLRFSPTSTPSNALTEGDWFHTAEWDYGIRSLDVSWGSNSVVWSTLGAGWTPPQWVMPGYSFVLYSWSFEGTPDGEGGYNANPGPYSGAGAYLYDNNGWAKVWDVDHSEVHAELWIKAKAVGPAPAKEVTVEAENILCDVANPAGLLQGASVTMHRYWRS